MENRNKKLVEKLIRIARCNESDFGLIHIIVNNDNLYINVEAVNDAKFNNEEISLLQNITKIVDIKVNQMTTGAYFRKIKFMKISSSNYEKDDKELQDRIETWDGDEGFVQYEISETRFPCSVLNYI